MTSSLSGLGLRIPDPGTIDQPHSQDPRDERQETRVLPRRASGPLSGLPKEMWPSFGSVFSEEGTARQGVVSSPSSYSINPLLTDSIYPYQSHPIWVFTAATISVAVQSLKEQGRIDPEAIAILMNDTDFHAGWIGSATAAYSRRKVGQAAAAVISKRVPEETMKKILQNRSAQFLGAVTNGLTYTVAVSSGFEYFSQFWKLATANIPNVHTVSDFVQAPRRDQIRVAANLFNYFLNTDIQKRIIKSVEYHRIMTFEFLAMNVGIFVGMVAGDILGRKLIPAAPSNWKQKVAHYFGRYLSKPLGGIIGGVAVQFVPDTFKMKINQDLLKWKTARAEASFQELLDQIQDAVAARIYPTWHFDSLMTGTFAQLDLQSDIEALIRRRDLLMSLYMQQYFVNGWQQLAFDQVKLLHQDTQESLLDLLVDVNRGHQELFLSGGFEKLSPQELENLIVLRGSRDRHQTHYTRVLIAAVDRLADTWHDYELYLYELSQIQLLKAEE